MVTSLVLFIVSLMPRALHIINEKEKIPVNKVYLGSNGLPRKRKVYQNELNDAVSGLLKKLKNNTSDNLIERKEIINKSVDRFDEKYHCFFYRKIFEDPKCYLGDTVTKKDIKDVFQEDLHSLSRQGHASVRECFRLGVKELTLRKTPDNRRELDEDSPFEGESSSDEDADRADKLVYPDFIRSVNISTLGLIEKKKLLPSNVDLKDRILNESIKLIQKINNSNDLNILSIVEDHVYLMHSKYHIYFYLNIVKALIDNKMITKRVEELLPLELHCIAIALIYRACKDKDMKTTYIELSNEFKNYRVQDGIKKNTYLPEGVFPYIKFLNKHDLVNPYLKLILEEVLPLKSP
jgi:hypothetical protein